MTWYDEAACKGKGDLFFPAPYEREGQRIIREAKAFAICASCRVRRECGSAAGENEGIWAGVDRGPGGITLTVGRIASPSRYQVGYRR